MKPGYIIIDKTINKYRNGKNKNMDIFLYAYIKLCSDFETGESHATQEKLHERTKIPISTMQKMISRLRKSNFIDVITVQKGIKKNNTYKFNINPQSFYFLDTTFFYTELDQALQGLILLIKSLSTNNTNTVPYNKTRIAEELGQDRGTVSKLIKELIDKNMLLEIEGGYVLPENYFPRYGKNGHERKSYENLTEFDKRALDGIIEHCNKKGTILFVPFIESIKKIAAKYSLNNEDEIPDGLRDTYHLPTVLEKKCPTLPQKIESLNYFLQVLNMETEQQGKKEDAILML